MAENPAGDGRANYDHRLDAQYEKLWQDTAAHAFLVGPERLVSSIHKHFAAAMDILVVNVFEDLGQFPPKDIRARIKPVPSQNAIRRQCL